MKNNQKSIAIVLLIFFCITSSCANTKNVKRDTLIIVGVAAGIVLGASIEKNISESSDDNDPADGMCGGGGGLLLLIGGLIGGWLGYGFDLATTPKEKTEPNVESYDKSKID